MSSCVCVCVCVIVCVCVFVCSECVCVCVLPPCPQLSQGETLSEPSLKALVQPAFPPRFDGVSTCDTQFTVTGHTSLGTYDRGSQRGDTGSVLVIPFADGVVEVRVGVDVWLCVFVVVYVCMAVCVCE